LTVSWLMRLVAGLSSRIPGFAPGSVCVGIVMEKAAYAQVLLRVLGSFPVIIIALWLSSFIYYLGDEQWKIGPLVAALQRHGLTPSTWIATTSSHFCHGLASCSFSGGLYTVSGFCSCYFFPIHNTYPAKCNVIYIERIEDWHKSDQHFLFIRGSICHLNSFYQILT
jgi:hypothetical protein